jgi:hypothetical protein
MVPVPLPDAATVRLSGGANAAFTFAALGPMDKLHAPVPEHAPVQPPKAEPPAGTAVKTTLDPFAKFEEQVGPQLMPAGALVTCPLPLPIRETLTGDDVELNRAPTAWAEFNVIEQAPVPEHAPLHPENTEPG